MKNRFFVWKDGKYNGENTTWLELNGKDFYEYITRSENRNRRFVKHYYNPYDHKEGFYKMEVTKENYKKWDANRKKAKRNQDVLDVEIIKRFLADKDDALSAEKERNIPTIVSFESLVKEDGEFTYHDIVLSEENEMEKILDNLILKDVYRALRSLSAEERELLNLLYFDNLNNRSEREIAKENNMSHQLLSYRKKKIIEKLKIIFANE